MIVLLGDPPRHDAIPPAQGDGVDYTPCPTGRERGGVYELSDDPPPVTISPLRHDGGAAYAFGSL